MTRHSENALTRSVGTRSGETRGIPPVARPSPKNGDARPVAGRLDEIADTWGGRGRCLAGDYARVVAQRFAWRSKGNLAIRQKHACRRLRALRHRGANGLTPVNRAGRHQNRRGGGQTVFHGPAFVLFFARGWCSAPAFDWRRVPTQTQARLPALSDRATGPSSSLSCRQNGIGATPRGAASDENRRPGQCATQCAAMPRAPGALWSRATRLCGNGELQRVRRGCHLAVLDFLGNHA